jgi:hypothetical protein
MNDLLSRPDHHSAPPGHQPLVRRSRLWFLGRFFSLFTGLVILLAFGSGVLLLLKDTPLSLLQHLAHAPISALPLLLIGLASLGFQVVTRPTPLDFFKAGLVSIAFILWGVDQLLPTGWEATTLGDIVIVLYVIDLGWMMGDRLKGQAWRKSVGQETQPLHLLPMSPDAQSPEPHPASDVSLWQRETQLGSPRSLRKTTSSSSILKRHRLIPLRGADHR